MNAARTIWCTLALSLLLFPCVGVGQTTDTLLQGIVKRLPPEGRYDAVEDRDDDGILVVKKDGKVGLLDRNLRVLAPCKYDNIDIGDGFVEVTVGEKHGVLDAAGKVIVSCIYDRIEEPFTADTEVKCLGHIVERDGGSTVIDQHGKELIPLFDGVLRRLNDSLLQISNGNSDGVITYYGRYVLPLIYKRVELLGKTDCFAVEDTNGKCGVLDINGGVRVPCRYDNWWCGKEEDKYISLADGYMWGCTLISSGRTVIPFVYGGVNHIPGTELFKVTVQGLEGLIDSSNKRTSPRLYYSLRYLGDEMFAVSVPDSVRYGEFAINKHGDTVLRDWYASIDYHQNSLFHLFDGRFVDHNDREVIYIERPFGHSIKNGRVEAPYRRGCGRSWNYPMRYFDTLGHEFRVFPEKGRYVDVDRFHNGMAAVVDPEGYIGFIDKQGREVVPCVYEVANVFSEGFAAVGQDHRWGIVNKRGQMLVDTVLTYCRSFSEGLAMVRGHDGAGYIDTNRRVVVPCLYEDATDFHNGLAAVKRTDQWAVINKKGRLLTEFRYSEKIKFSEGMAAVCDQGRWSYIDTTGKVVIRLSDTIVKCGPFSSGKAPVSGEHLTGFIDRHGAVVIPFKFLFATQFVTGRASYLIEKEKATNTDYRYGMLDEAGHAITKPIYKNMYFAESSGLVLVEGTFGMGIIDRNGRTIVPCVYEQLYTDDLSEGLITAKLGGKWGFIDRAGKMVIPYKYDEAMPFSEGLAGVKKDGKWGFIDKKGKMVLQFK